jgi:hypothetical protein
MNTTKNILQSKTFWFNVLSLGATIAGYLPPQYAAVVIPLVNLGLRLVTSQGVNILGN